MFISPDIPFHSTAEQPGKAVDVQFLQEDKWLMNTEVRYLLQEKRSRWYLTMVFIATDNPFKLRCRPIDNYPSQAKAETFAQILQRGIRKDARGTLKTNKNAFNICEN